MKIKNLIALVGLFVLATSATFSVKTETAEDPAMKGISDESFIEFLSQFEKKELPFNIGLEDMTEYENFNENKKSKNKVAKFSSSNSPLSRSKFLPWTQYARMSRMGRPEMAPIARFYPNEKMIAVIYSSSLSFSKGMDKSYVMVVYDMQGNVLPKSSKEDFGVSHLVAQSGVSQSVTCHIDKKGRVWKNKYKNIWKEDLDKKWINENELTGFEITDTEVFELDKNGKLEKLKEVPSVAKACLN